MPATFLGHFSLAWVVSKEIATNPPILDAIALTSTPILTRYVDNALTESFALFPGLLDAIN